MVKDTLKKALEDAVGYYNGGMTANESIVKAASDHDLTIDQTDRVVESFNTAKTINFFDKNASDRTGKFDLASKKDVTLSLFGKEAVEKKDMDKKASCNLASAKNDPFSYTFYSTSPDTSCNRKNVFAMKRAAFLDAAAKVAEDKWAHGYSDSTFSAMASDALSTVKFAEKDISDAIGMLDSYIITATEKIASDLSRGGYDIPSDRADMFKAACPHTHVVEEVSKISPLLKRATGGHYIKDNVVDTSSIEDLLKEADDIMYAEDQKKSLVEKKAEFSAKAERLTKAVLSDPSLREKVASNSSPEGLVHRPSVKAAQFDIFSVSEPKKIIDATTSVDKRKKENEALRNEARGALIGDLLSSDPILKDADPRQVAAIYRSILMSSPRVSLNKEIVRSVLRGAVNSIALSPNDAKVLTEVDDGVRKSLSNAFRLSELDSSIKDSSK